MSSENQKTAVVVTSTSSIDYFFNVEDLPLSVLRLHIKVGENDYVDGESIRTDTLYQILRENPRLLPATREPEPGDVLGTFRKLKSRGYTHILVLTLSQKISLSYKTIKELAATMSGVDIVVYDTGTASVPEGMFAYKAAQMAKKGVPVADIVKALDRMKPDTEIYFCLNDLSYLYRQGHLKGAKSLMSRLLQIKPIILFKDGEFHQVENIRKIDSALEFLAELISGRMKNPNLVAMGLFMANHDTYRKFTSMLPVDLRFEYPLTPVIGAHLGIDGLGIGFCNRIDGEV